MLLFFVNFHNKHFLLNLTAKYSDPELLTLLKSKNDAAFNYLYEHFSGGLYSTILQIIPERNDADKVLQETFLNISYRINSYDESKGKLFTWMLNIARNLSLNFLKSKSANGYSAGIFKPERSLTETDNKSFYNSGLKKATQQLTPEETRIIDLAYFKGYTQEEIAKEKGITVTLAKQELRNALIQLRAYLK